ncbi:MAG: protease modulator HflC [SAR324 cluster bacterium]|nr:protease modulator HflC [SAR324 cluster bacterium]
MKSFSAIKILLFIVIGLVVAYSATAFVIDQTEYAVKIRLGDPVRIYKEPGLHFRIPFITEIFVVDNRLLTYDADPGSIFTKDKKEMVVDNYAKWKVTDPLKFYQTMRSTSQAQARLDDIIYSQVRQVLGQHTLTEIVSGSQHSGQFSTQIKNSVLDAEAINLRKSILKEITENAQKEARAFGIEIEDVRIKRADLPTANSRAVYGRMEAERRRDAKRYRSEGEEQSLSIRSAADRDRIKLLAEAQKKSEEIRGTADASSVSIYAAAYGKDPDFFKFQRSHDAYRETMKEGTTLLLSSERDFFESLK